MEYVDSLGRFNLVINNILDGIRPDSGTSSTRGLIFERAFSYDWQLGAFWGGDKLDFQTVGMYDLILRLFAPLHILFLYRFAITSYLVVPY